MRKFHDINFGILEQIVPFRVADAHTYCCEDDVRIERKTMASEIGFVSEADIEFFVSSYHSKLNSLLITSLTVTQKARMM